MTELLVTAAVCVIVLIGFEVFVFDAAYDAGYEIGFHRGYADGKENV